MEKYKGKSLLVTRENAVKLGKNEYFIADMIGMKVITEDEKEFGRLKDVLATGANDVYVVQTLDNKEILLPAIKQCILKIDIDNQIMTVHIMKGLLDE
ncbi:16S rRNA processing protein RimM [Lachnotalea glycerini]|nr:16S rRNA processing protein RimM [Lachnotalea glycerini]